MQVRHDRPKLGDAVVLASPGHSARSADRCGEIVELVGAENAHYLVRWLDGGTSVLSASAVASTLASPCRPRRRRGDRDPREEADRADEVQQQRPLVHGVGYSPSVSSRPWFSA